jgi:hypothetical protein
MKKKNGTNGNPRLDVRTYSLEIGNRTMAYATEE